jgi:proline iminopeptidase
MEISKYRFIHKFINRRIFLHSLYPKIEPFDQQHLNRGSLHQIYIEQCGNKNGIPVVFLHGGPGAGCNEQHRCYFDPAIYHIILFDQRGCGRSIPKGELSENNTAALVEDVDAIREHLGISQWLIFGGSWGATLGLIYAQNYPQNVSGMILRGVFLGRPQDIDWAYSSRGAAQLLPQAWHNLVESLPFELQQKPLQHIYQQLINSDEAISRDMFFKLQQWESAILNIQPYQPPGEDATINKNPAIIQIHYSVNNCFIDQNPILKQIDKVRDIPMQIIHGQYDFVCPVEQAWLLSHYCPKAKINVIDTAGHLASEPLIIDALIVATIAFYEKLSAQH